MRTTILLNLMGYILLMASIGFWSETSYLLSGISLGMFISGLIILFYQKGLKEELKAQRKENGKK